MFGRYFSTFNVFILFAVVISCNAAEKPKTQVETRILFLNPGLSIALRIIRKAFKWAAKHCLKEAANNCKQHWKHPKALINCAKNFLRTNKGRCLVG